MGGKVLTSSDVFSLIARDVIVVGSFVTKYEVGLLLGAEEMGASLISATI